MLFNDAWSLKDIQRGLIRALYELHVTHNNINMVHFCLQVKERLQIRPADSEDAVRKRLAQYNAYAEELDEYYTDTAQHVNADQDPHTVFECIESMIVNPLPKQFP